MSDVKPKKNHRKEARERDARAGLVTRVLRLRLRDRHAKYLTSLAGEVNLVWNYCNEISQKILEREHRWCDTGDLHFLTKGAGKEGLRLHSQTIQAINEEYVTRRKQFKKRRLNWRVSNPKSARRSLGWIPFKKPAVKFSQGQFFLAGVPLGFIRDSYGLKDYELGSGNISEDSCGRWYLNVTVKVKKQPKTAAVQGEALGIDLGLKDLMTGSNGLQVEAQQFYRDLEPKLAVAQRAGKKNRVRALHTKIANRRKDHLHKLSTALVQRCGAIFVGDVNAQALAQTRMAKSVLDAGWGQFKTMLQYKCDDAGVWLKEIDERYSTQDCHACGSRSGPKGREGLKVREWTCPDCGTQHGRDLNAALNIRQRGLEWLEQEFSAAAEAKARETATNKDSGATSAMAGVGLTL